VQPPTAPAQAYAQIAAIGFARHQARLANTLADLDVDWVALGAIHLGRFLHWHNDLS
jgi:hypothetical protein